MSIDPFKPERQWGGVEVGGCNPELLEGVGGWVGAMLNGVCWHTVLRTTTCTENKTVQFGTIGNVPKTAGNEAYLTDRIILIHGSPLLVCHHRAVKSGVI